MTPLLGGLLLNCRVFLCLNLGGPDPGPVALTGALPPDFASGLATSRFMLLLTGNIFGEVRNKIK